MNRFLSAFPERLWQSKKNLAWYDVKRNWLCIISPLDKAASCPHTQFLIRLPARSG